MASTTTFRKHGLEHVAHELSASALEAAALGLTDRALVYGAPGTGKTTVLKALYLNRLAEGAKSHEILAITANRDAANLLRDELALGYGGATSGPMARTLSSFAFSILRDHALREGTRAPELITGAEQDVLLKEILAELAEGGHSPLWPDQIGKEVLALQGFRAELRELFTVCLENNITPSELGALGVKHGQKAWEASAEVFAKYLEVLEAPAQDNRHDPSTLLAKAAELLMQREWPEFASVIRMILVDDAQELTPGAKKLLKVLTSKGAGLVLFGDPDSATLGFRSADPQSMRLLMQDVAGAATWLTINLEPTHRVRDAGISTAMANIAAEIPPELAGPQRKSLGATNQIPESGVEGMVFDSPASESAWVARRLRDLHLNHGVAWSEMAVVARSRALLETFGAALATESVPAVVYGTQKALRHEYASGALLQLAKQVLEPQELDFAAAREFVESPFCDLDSLELRRLRRQLRQADLNEGLNRSGDELIVEAFNKPGSIATLDSDEGRKLFDFINKIESAKVLAKTPGKTIEDLLWHFWSESTPQQNWPAQTANVSEVAQQAGRNLDSVVALFAAANRYVERNPNGTMLEFVKDQLELDLPQDTLAAGARDDQRVLMLTSAGLIGRRFKVVVIPQLIEGVWPNLKPRSSLLGAVSLAQLLAKKTSEVEAARSELPEELRLLNKAVGAASDLVIVTSVNGEDTQVSQFVSLVLGQTPATTTHARPRYTLRGKVGELRRKLIEAATERERLAAAYGLAQLASHGIEGARPDQWYGILDLSTEEALVVLDGTKQVFVAPSQLEDFMKCPLHWFIKHHGGRDGGFEANFGTMLHEALEQAQGISEQELWELVESKWHNLEFEAAWMDKKEKRLAREKVQRLAAYLEQSKNAGFEVIAREADFSFRLGDAYIAGTVDRIERNAEGQVLIVDLKTGQKETGLDALKHPQMGLYQLAFVNGAFAEYLEPTDTLLGAKLVFVKERLSLVDQPAINKPDVEYDVKYFEELVQTAARDMAMESKVFIAKIGSHCTSDNYASCEVLLTRAVSYVD